MRTSSGGSNITKCINESNAHNARNAQTIYVVVCTDLSGKELHRQVGMGTVMTSGILHGIYLCELWCGELAQLGRLRDT